MSRREEFRAGVAATAPVAVGILPFGLVAGAAAVAAGLSVAQAIALSVVVFAGASQLAVIELLGNDAALAVVVGTALVINARFVMYSASLAPHLLDDGARWRGLSAYLLTDQAFALSAARFRDGLDTVERRRWYYLGTAAPLWVVWQAATVVGAVGGARVPPWLPLEFAVPLVFLALLVPTVDSRPAAAAALVGGGIATAGAGLPFNLGLLAGALAGVGVGTALAERTGARPEVAE